MEEKDAQTFIRDSEFVSILGAAKDKDAESILLLIDLFKEDIKHISRYIRLPEEEAASEIICEFLEFVLDHS
ncbi:hypothetical protein P4H27_08405 [Paenibacillus taichungensis]|uniref:hypothetical protein n=1 Tax=Paenibacillus TaxID=44249 RepID=UPI00237ADD8B|nr:MULTISPECIES: hypothetical protein [Paenibacillus]MEC0106957.1 hypothetical protein [Paenibacillus taichungensis]MEC0195113.1 hypothetical protein [Paenibacillus taichungensis]WDQ35116.1 hypothetical protein PTQ21_13140 [Paenibacillus marchantiae]